MSLTTSIYKIVSKTTLIELEKMRLYPNIFQRKIFDNLISSGKNTLFGEEHNLKNITDYKAFQKIIPIREYNDFEKYINRCRKGERNILWNSPIKWFAKSSGTSSAKSKFIPITEQSLNSCHFSGMKKMLATYVNNNPKTKIFDGNALTLGGSIQVDEIGNGKSIYGDLSAILLKNSPFWVEHRRVPRLKTALLADFERKVEIMCRVANKYNVTNFSGVPSWNLALLNRILKHKGKSNILEIWPNLELFMHGGISFDPYREQFKKIIPSNSMNYMENYNASEGYFAFQDDPKDSSLLLLLNNGIFYEFIPMDNLHLLNENRWDIAIPIEEVKTDINYAMVITTNGGLWRYLIGDCVKFTSINPYKIIITGRTQLFINAFGEELMINNAEQALAKTINICDCSINNYTVAPIFFNNKTVGTHQWIIEFDKYPSDLSKFIKELDNQLSLLNSDYEAKRKNSVTMSEPVVTPVKQGTFYKWMEKRGKLGGQNKVPRLYPKRDYVDELLSISLKEV